jgi:hypothetical protein
MTVDKFPCQSFKGGLLKNNCPFMLACLDCWCLGVGGALTTVVAGAHGAFRWRPS